MWKLFQLLGVVMYISYPHTVLCSALLSPSQMTLFGQYSVLITKNDILYLHPDAARMSQIHDQVLSDLTRVWQLILNVTPLPLQGQTILHPPVDWASLVQLFLITKLHSSRMETTNRKDTISWDAAMHCIAACWRFICAPGCWLRSNWLGLGL